MRRCVLWTIVFCWGAWAEAAKVQTWVQAGSGEFQAGKRENVMVMSDGAVLLAPRLEPLADLAANQIWNAVADADGNVFAVTGNPGILIRLDRSGGAKPLLRDESLQFFAVAVDKSGNAYVGTSPGGKIIKVSPTGATTVYYETKETYVWALAFDDEQNLYAATGVEGRLHVIAPTGTGRVVFAAKEKHLLSMVVRPDGMTYLGTSDRGLVYRVERTGSAFVLFDAPQAEISSLTFHDGYFYVGTAAADARSAGSSSGSESKPETAAPGSSTTSNDAKPTENGEEKKPVQAGGPKEKAEGSSSGSSSSTGSTASAGAPTKFSAAPGTSNSLYRIGAEGEVEELFRTKLPIYSVAKQSGDIWVAAGQAGQVFVVLPESNAAGEMLKLPHRQVSSLIPTKQGIVLLASGEGKAYRHTGKFAERGKFTSSVLDAKQLARWGEATWRFYGAKITFQFRVGNVADPDATWTAWSNDPNQLPPARFYQYQADFVSTDGTSTPVLKEVVQYYATINKAPIVESITIPNRNLNPTTVGDANKLKLTWKATDENNDRLNYKLELRRESWPTWVLAAENLEKTEFEIDVTTLPQGSYVARVTASDSRDNNQATLKTGQKVSDSFNIDRTPPTVKLVESKLTDGRKWALKVQAEDDLLRLTEASYAIDGKPWRPLQPDDGLFDTLQETITFNLDELLPGGHLIMIRVRNAAGLEGLADALITIP